MISFTTEEMQSFRCKAMVRRGVRQHAEIYISEWNQKQVVVKDACGHWNGKEAAIVELAVLKMLQGAPSAHCLPMLGYYECPNRVCIVMEHCSGGDLFEYMLSVPRTSPVADAFVARSDAIDQIKTIAHQMAHGLRDLHVQGWAHGDLSLENVLLKESVAHGAAIEAVLFDYGQAHPLSDLNYYSQGKDGYRAPELVLPGRRSRSIDWAACDCFALGVCIFALVFKTTPMHVHLDFKDSDPVWKNVKEGNRDVLPLSACSHLADASALQDLLCGLLCEDPHARMTAHEVLAHRFFAPPAVGQSDVPAMAPPLVSELRDSGAPTESPISSSSADAEHDGAGTQLADDADGLGTPSVGMEITLE